MNGRIIRANGDAVLGFPRVGKIKTGYKTENGYPKSTDYFIPSGKYAGLFKSAYGDKPNTLQIVFPSDDASLCCNERYEYRNDQGGLLAKGDGKIFEVWDGKKYNTLNSDQYPDLMAKIQGKHPNQLATKTGDGWCVHLEINFLLPKIRGIAGVWTYETKGVKSSIPNITGAFDMMLAQRGKVMGVLFDLNVAYAKTQKPDDKSRFPVVTLIPNESQEAIERLRAAVGEPTMKILGASV